MNNEKKRHLDENQIIRALVDASKLSSSMRKHLEYCDQCSCRIAGLEKKLAQLGRVAEQFAPLPHEGLNFSKLAKPKPARWLGNWRPALGTAIALAAFIIFIWWSGQEREAFKTNGGAKLVADDVKGSESLMTAIGIISENALPQAYLDIAGETESEMYEDFINFIVPLVENDSLTFTQGGKEWDYVKQKFQDVATAFLHGGTCDCHG